MNTQMGKKISLVALLVVWLTACDGASQRRAAIEKLRDDLVNGPSATQVLTQYCADLKLAAVPVVRAVRDETLIPAPPAVRASLQAGEDEPIRHRRVRLVCGEQMLSAADNWYVPARLTPEMNQQLDETDTSFGTVVRPLNFHRETLEAALTDDSNTILRITALLRTPENVPFSMVVELYRPVLVESR
jgi:DNA-binding GntR family transcriptional regulator